MTIQAHTHRSIHHTDSPGFKEFAILIAALMATNALAVDIMLPALPAISAALHITTENERQWIITAYLLGFGGAQIIYGPLSDRYGRKPILLTGLFIYIIFAELAAHATTLDTMLTYRLMQGIGGAATRVLAISIIRDRFVGDQMARVASLAIMAALAIPIAAPWLGQFMMQWSPWTIIFHGLTFFGVGVSVWVMWRLPETSPRAGSRPNGSSWRNILQAFKAVANQYRSTAYMSAAALMMGTIFAFIHSAQQVFSITFDLSDRFPLIYGVIALFMAISAAHNARIVSRHGARAVSHLALAAFCILATLQVSTAWLGQCTAWSFCMIQALMMYAFGFIIANFTALAMQPLGHVAGTASSVQGLVTTTGGALIGFAIGQCFDGSVLPLSIGIALCGMAALVIVTLAERRYRLIDPSIKTV